MRLLPFLLLIPGALFSQSQSSEYSVQPARIDTSVTIDGNLNEAVWQQAARLNNFSQYEPVDSRPAEDSTVVLVWYSSNAIYFGIKAYDRMPESVRATVSDRDNIGDDDKVTIYLDTFNDRRRAYFFGVNPYGIQDDGVRTEGGFAAGSGGGGGTDRSPDFIWQSKGVKTDFGWMAEIEIPFKSLRWNSGSDLTWGINVSRVTMRTGYQDTWTNAKKASSSFLTQSGTLTGITGISRGVVTEFQPTFTANYPGSRLPDGSFERGALKGEFGANMRLGFTQLTLDATVNPDFSQVESDAGLVTVNERFAVQIPERRPFFLEGIELFASPNNLVYTRRVTNPVAGAKLTGKLGSWTLAHLTAIDEFRQSPVSSSADGKNGIVNMTRIRRDVGRNSIAGITLTNRDEGSNYNRVLAADTRLLFGGMYYIQAQAGASFTRKGESDEVVVDPLWQVTMDRTGRAYGFNYSVSGVGQDFETWSGFVNRRGIVNMRASNRYSYYGERGALIETFTLRGGLARIQNYSDFTGSSIEGSQDLNASMKFRGGWDVSTKGELTFVRFEPADYANYRVAGPDQTILPFPLAKGVFNSPNFEVSLSTPVWRLWQWSVSAEMGRSALFPEAAKGKAKSVSASITMRPSPALRVFGTLAMEQLNRSRDNSEFARTVLPRVKLEYQPNHALFFRLVTEYRDERRDALLDPVSGAPILVNGSRSGAQESKRLRMDWLASYEPTPGTVAFFGYGSTMDRDESPQFNGMRRTNDSFFMKIAYLFRR